MATPDSLINDLWSFALDRLGDMDEATSSLDRFVEGWVPPAIPQYHELPTAPVVELPSVPAMIQEP
jgi:hypothetical protein